MADRGWGRQGNGIPLSERIRPAAPGPDRSPPVALATPSPPFAPSATRDPSARTPAAGCPARHCWVADAIDKDGVKRPGLLVEWRPVDGGWQGRVAYVARVRGERWALVEEWLPSSMLTPL